MPEKEYLILDHIDKICLPIQTHAKSTNPDQCMHIHSTKHCEHRRMYPEIDIFGS